MSFLRDAHHILVMPNTYAIDDSFPIAESFDQVAFGLLWVLGVQHFDSLLIRLLGDDPGRIRQELKKACQKPTSAKLLRGPEPIRLYRHYSDDVVNNFVERRAALWL